MTLDEAMAEALLAAREPEHKRTTDQAAAIALAAEVLRLREQVAHLNTLALRGRTINAAAGSPVRRSP